MKLKFLVLMIIIAFNLSGCDYKFSETTQNEGNTNISNTQITNQSNNSVVPETNKSVANSALESEIESGAKLTLTGMSESATFPCGGREVEIVKDATANNYTLTGECKKLTVDGVSNTVNVEKAGEISVKGVSNKVTYGEGLNGKKPKISKTGVSTSVDARKPLEEKE